MKEFKGSCTCGQNHFTAKISCDDQKLIAVPTLGAGAEMELHLTLQKELFQFTAKNENSLVTMESSIAQHMLCGDCGDHLYTLPHDRPDQVNVNARCLDDFHLLHAEFEIIPFFEN